MSKASEVATELRRIAESLDQEPEAEIERPALSWYVDEKQTMQALARILPHPLKKEIQEGTFGSVKLEAVSCTVVHVYASIPRSKVCRLVKEAQPAQYDCQPLLSDEETSTLIAGA